MTKIIDRTFKEAIEDGVFPSAEILVAKGMKFFFMNDMAMPASTPAST